MKILDRLIIVPSRTTASKKSTELFFKFLFLSVFLTFVRLTPNRNFLLTSIDVFLCYAKVLVLPLFTSILSSSTPLRYGFFCQVIVNNLLTFGLNLLSQIIMILPLRPVSFISFFCCFTEVLKLIHCYNKLITEIH